MQSSSKGGKLLLPMIDKKGISLLKNKSDTCMSRLVEKAEHCVGTITTTVI